MAGCRKFPKPPGPAQLERCDSLTGASFRKASARAAGQLNGATNGKVNSASNGTVEHNGDIEMGRANSQACPFSMSSVCVRCWPPLSCWSAKARWILHSFSALAGSTVLAHGWASQFNNM